MINSIKDLAEELEIHNDGADTFEDQISRISKLIYKGTDCGAWVDWIDDDYGISGVRCGSIVEGSDFETSYDLKFPFDIDEFWNIIRIIELECDEAWNDMLNEDNNEY